MTSGLEKCFIKVFMKSLNKLVDDAIHLCREYDYDKVSPYLFQRRLMVDYDTGELVFRELEKRGIITDAHIIDEDTEDENIIGIVDKEKLKKFFMN